MGRVKAPPPVVVLAPPLAPLTADPPTASVTHRGPAGTMTAVVAGGEAGEWADGSSSIWWWEGAVVALGWVGAVAVAAGEEAGGQEGWLRLRLWWQGLEVGRQERWQAGHPPALYLASISTWPLVGHAKSVPLPAL